MRGGVRIPGGEFWMGDAFDEGYEADREGPPRRVSVAAFSAAETTVTNQAFAAFVKATGHVTTAEQVGDSLVFHLAYEARAAAEGRDGSDIVGQSDGTPWWLAVAGATWRTPEGRGSSVDRRANHPVVHVSHDDAVAYAAWAGARLLTEIEWEYAARGGLDRARFPWGDDLLPRGRHQMNTWQGDFPTVNTCEDGWLTTAPVRSYRPNGYGLWQCSGNVWEWTADWFTAAGEVGEAPPATGEARVIRGGSYLCHASYCHRYRVSARTSSEPASTAGNLGFRIGADSTTAT